MRVKVDHPFRVIKRQFGLTKVRFRGLANTDPQEAERLTALAQEAIDLRWNTYEDMASLGRHHFPSDPRPADTREER